ncbi:MAG: cation diffusion facilitator family transporter [Candidatus Melainabacteria bacterium]
MDSDPAASSAPAIPLKTTVGFPTSPGYLYQHATSSILVAMAVNFLIAAVKGLAWAISQSPVMLSESLHSLGDGINSIALLIGIRLSQRQPDKTHPFGYGLEASVWAVPACVLLAVFSGIAIWHGWNRLSEPESHMNFLPGLDWIDPFYFSVVILIISVVMEIFALERASRAVLEEVGYPDDLVSPFGLSVMNALPRLKQVVGPTTRFVFYEESIALLGALLALVAITLSQFSVELGLLDKEYAHYPDVVASMFIGVLMLGMAVYLFFHNRSILTGTAAGPKVQQKIHDLVLSLHGVSAVHDLAIIDRGPAGLSIHMKVEVEPDTMVKDVDDLVERIKEKIHRRIPNVGAEQVFIEVLADETDTEWGERFLSLIQEGREVAVLKPREEALLRNLYRFTEVTVYEVMVPRTDVIAVEINTTLNDLANMVVEVAHSRYPIYEGNVDNVVGMVHARDIFEHIQKQQMAISVSDIMRPISIYPENKPASDLLEDFKRNKLQMAAVVDEHGGFAGIVTIEDLMEEIVGDIWDEHDEEELEFELRAPNQVYVNGKYEISHLNERLKLNVPDDDFMTVAGFVFGELGREPKAGDQITFEDLTITVAGVDAHRITHVLIESPVDFILDRRDEDEPAGEESGETTEQAR